MTMEKQSTTITPGGTTDHREGMTTEHLVTEAEAAMAWEHSLSPSRALKLYRTAVMFGAFVSTTLVMEGFDTKVMGSLYAVPTFRTAYGTQASNGSYQISAPWQSGMMGITGVSCIVGMFVGGYVTEKIGFRKTMIGTLLSMPPIIFIFFFAPSLEVIAVANFLFGKY